MPFTPTHAAAAIPIAWMCRWRVPLTAIAIGSMVPDMPSFFPGIFSYNDTHSVQGIFTHCTPIGLVFYYLFHGLLKHPLGALLPDTISRRLHLALERRIDFSVPRVMIVIAMVAIGAFTHLVWDSFTHGERWGVQRFPFLNNVVFDWKNRPVRWYAILQHGSSIVLLPPMLIGFVLWVRNMPIIGEEKPRYRVSPTIVLIVLLLMIAGMLGYWRIVMFRYPNALWIETLRVSVKHVGTCVLVSGFVYCVWMQLVWWSEELRQERASDKGSDPTTDA